MNNNLNIRTVGLSNNQYTYDHVVSEPAMWHSVYMNTTGTQAAHARQLCVLTSQKILREVYNEQDRFTSDELLHITVTLIDYINTLC